MDVILHIGAHRCATTTFQGYLRRNAARLARDGTGFWGPGRTRNGLFSGLSDAPPAGPVRDPLRRARRARGRIRLNLRRSADAGLERLVVSDENMLGAMGANRRAGGLYPAAGERIARFAEAFGIMPLRLALTIRAPEIWWPSALGYGLSRGAPLPGSAELEAIAAARRGWREVITDLACAAPNAQILVLPFEVFAGRPDAQLAALIDRAAPNLHSRDWRNPTPRLEELRQLRPDLDLPDGSGRWQPFTPVQTAQLRRLYEADMAWLTAGADGLARLVTDPDKTPAGENPPTPDATRGRRDEQDRRLAGAG